MLYARVNVVQLVPISVPQSVRLHVPVPGVAFEGTVTRTQIGAFGPLLVVGLYGLPFDVGDVRPHSLSPTGDI